MSAGAAAKTRSCSGSVPPIWTSARSVKPALKNAPAASATASTESPQGIEPATSSGRTKPGAPGKPRRARQFRVDLPATAEPAELLVRPTDVLVPVRAPADRHL